MAKLISQRYAQALFELALESQNIDLYYEQVNTIYKALLNDVKFLDILNHPQITCDEKMSMFNSIFKGKVSNDILGLFSVVLSKNRESEIIEMLKLFLEKVDDFKGIVNAYVYCASELTDVQINIIKQKLSQNLNKQVVIHTEVLPELIGGIRINVQGHVIDGSIKKRLDDLKKQLLNSQLA